MDVVQTGIGQLDGNNIAVVMNCAIVKLVPRQSHVCVSTFVLFIKVFVKEMMLSY